MKALTITQPWASLVVAGVKRIETRSWSTAYRGPLAIHAAKGYPRWAREFADELFRDPLRGIPDDVAMQLIDPPLGAVIGTVTLVDVAHVEWIEAHESHLLAPRERELGDFSTGRFGWILADPVAHEPTPARGALGLWEWR